MIESCRRTQHGGCRRGTALIAVVASFACFGALSSTAAAVSWVPVASGTSDSISALSYTGPGRLVFVTGTGKAFRLTTGGFVPGSGITVGTALNDVSFSPGGATGVVVGNTGTVYRTTDGGASWSPVTLGNYWKGFCSASQAPVATPLSTIDLNAVRFASPSVVYATGGDSVILRSSDGGASFSEINHHTDGTCTTGPDPGQGGTDALTGTAWSGAMNGYVVAQDFGALFSTTNGFASSAAHKDTTNGYQGRIRIALDPTNPGSLWTVNGESNAMGDAYTGHSTDFGNSWNLIERCDANGSCLNSNGELYSYPAMRDVAAYAGTVLMAGYQGDAFTSIDGQHFYLRPTGIGSTWNAVGLYDASHGAIAGDNGELLLTSDANSAGNGGGSTPASPGATSTNVDGGEQSVTLHYPSGCVKTAKTVKLSLTLARTRAFRRRHPHFRLLRVAFYIDRGLSRRRRVHGHLKVLQLANAVRGRAPFAVNLPTRGLSKGIHHVRVVVVLYRTVKVGRHGHRRITITKTLRSRITVC